MRLTLLTFIILHTMLFSQTKAMTSDGKEVLLNDDGSWNYAEESVTIDTDDSGIWKVNYYVDDFGDPTDSGYISNLNISSVSDMTTGTFSNSATTNAKLYIAFIIEKDTFSFKLLEYGSNAVTGSSGYPTYYKIKVKHNGKLIEGYSKIIEGRNSSERISISNKKDLKKLLELFNSGGTMSFSIVEKTDYSASTYRFKVDVDGFSVAYNSLYKE